MSSWALILSSSSPVPLNRKETRIRKFRKPDLYDTRLQGFLARLHAAHYFWWWWLDDLSIIIHQVFAFRHWSHTIFAGQLNWRISCSPHTLFCFETEFSRLVNIMLTILFSTSTLDVFETKFLSILHVLTDSFISLARSVLSVSIHFEACILI